MHRILRVSIDLRIGPFFLLFTLLTRGAVAQTPANDPLPPPGPARPVPEQTAVPTPAETEQHPRDELTTRDAPATFKVRVNLVQVRVVVRDQDGKVVPNLHREDFQILDNHKPQLLSSFNVETEESRAAAVPDTGGDANLTSQKSAEVENVAVRANRLPQRFVAMVFDDMHLSLEDAVFVRTEATHFLGTLTSIDRVAIYSTSGEFKQDFTDDRELLRKTLLKIIPHSSSGNGYHPCPEVTYYEADQFLNQNNSVALEVAAQDTLQCDFGGDLKMIGEARLLDKQMAASVLSTGDAETSYTYQHLNDITRRLAEMPGERIMVMISPGFIMSRSWLQMSELMDRANLAKIVINTIDARGLYTSDLNGDIADPPSSNGRVGGLTAMFRVQQQSAQEEVLADLALGTGGTYFHNRNDVGVGMQRAAAAPEVSYLLGYAPQNLKIDGKLHDIKVILNDNRKVTIQARRGYYAPRTIADPAAAAKADIEEAIFSQDEVRDLPVELQTQFFKKDANDARIAVLSHFDLRTVHFRKVDGRSNDSLTIATAIFDQNGNFVTGGEKILQMKLLESTYDRLSRSGVTVKSSFDVKPGTYMVRLVVRDGEGAEMAARNGSVVIPF
jgi:VWFA-related protein